MWRSLCEETSPIVDYVVVPVRRDLPYWILWWSLCECKSLIGSCGGTSGKVPLLLDPNGCLCAKRAFLVDHVVAPVRRDLPYWILWWSLCECKSLIGSCGGPCEKEPLLLDPVVVAPCDVSSLKP
jgi:hypothetical protein